MARRFWRRFASGRKKTKERAERSEIKVFWGAFFSKKVRPFPCPYRRAAHIKKLGKQGLCPAFPGRWHFALSVTADAVPAPPEGEPSLASPFGGGALPWRAERASSAAYAAHVRWPLDEHERSELPQARMESPGTGPRIARGATPPPGSFCLVKGKSEVFFRDFSLFAGESGCFLQNPRAVL